MKSNIKICYIGGGSKLWARVFMSDLAVAEGLSGEMALYDIDTEAAKRNARIGARINENPKTKSKFEYNVYEDLDEALKGRILCYFPSCPAPSRKCAVMCMSRKSMVFTSRWATRRDRVACSEP